MSLKFLAVGQSIVGIGREKSPYALRKDNRLPSFEKGPRFKEPEKMVQTDWLDSARPGQAPPGAMAAPVAGASVFEGEVSSPRPLPSEGAVQSTPATCGMPGALVAAKAKRRWWSIFNWRWFRTSKPANEFVQSELSLEKIQVMRNDLADADLELVLKRKKKAKPVFSSVQQNEQLPRQGWSELTAKLFDIGQK